MDMETRWLIFKRGGTVQNTKVENRALGLFIKDKAWKNIQKHLDRKRLIQEAHDKEVAHRRSVREESHSMARNWDNSAENIQKRKDEARKEKALKTRDDRMQRYFEMRKEQAVVREQLVRDAQKIIYTNTEFPRKLNSALIECEALYEREKQPKLKIKMQQHEREEAEKYALKVKQAAEEERLEKLEKKRAVYEKNVEMKKIYLKEIQQKAELHKSLKQERIEQERKDSEIATREMEKIKFFELEKDKQEKVNMKFEISNSVKEQKVLQDYNNALEKEAETIARIYLQTKHRVQCIRKKKEQESAEAFQLKQEALGNVLAAKAAARLEHEKRLLQKAEEECEQVEKGKLLAQAEYKKKLAEGRLVEQQAFLKRDEQRKFEANEVRKWEMLNRFKVDEARKQYEIDQKKQQWDNTLQFRNDLLVQMAENDEQRRKIKDEQDLLYKLDQEQIAEEDAKFFDYAEEVYQHAQNRGRPTKPIQRVIEEYKKYNGLPRVIVKKCEILQLQKER